MRQNRRRTTIHWRVFMVFSEVVLTLYVSAARELHTWKYLRNLTHASSPPRIWRDVSAAHRCTGKRDGAAVAPSVALDSGSMEPVLSEFPGLRVFDARSVSLDRHGKPGCPRGRAPVVWMVRPNAWHLGRNDSAVVGTAV